MIRKFAPIGSDHLRHPKQLVDVVNLVHRKRSKHSRGQGLVEMALLLPLLVLLLVMAVDFGRVFFSWVALNNAARIGADTAASYADIWSGVADGDQASERDRYRERIRQDLQSVGCQDAPIPDPIFDTDVNGDGSFFTDGDLVRMELECDFGLLTPLAEQAVGGPLTIRAVAEFAITRVINGGMPPLSNPCPAGQAPVPTLTGETMEDARAEWTGDGFAIGNYMPAVTPSNKNRVVLTQSLSAGVCAELTAVVTVTF